MKKTIALIAACLIAAAAFAGCGNNNASSAADGTSAAAVEEATTVAAAEESDADITGTWTVSSFVAADGTEYSVAEYAEQYGVEESTLTISYTFDAEGKATCTGLGATAEGTYTFDGTKVKTSFEASSPEFDFNAEKDTLSVTEATTGVTSVMTR